MRSRKFLQAEQATLMWDTPGLVAGVDEAGRGPLAGPVVAAAVILDDLHPIAGLADSKKLSAARREKLYDEIRAKALCCSIAEASVEEIDRLNILQATLLAMRRAVEGLRLKPAKVLVDGNRLPVLDVLAEAIVKGDATGAGHFGRLHPGQGASRPLVRGIRPRVPAVRLCRAQGLWHGRALGGLAPHGACPQHRKTFAPVAEVLAMSVERREPPASRANAPVRSEAQEGRQLRAHRHGPLEDAVAATSERAAECSTSASRDNPLLKELRRLSQDSTAYRKTGRFWVEGDHLCRAALLRGCRPAIAVFAESVLAALAAEIWCCWRPRRSLVPDALFDGLSGLESPARMGFVFDLPADAALQPAWRSVILDRVQDAGNVGSILRSAAAFGFHQVIALKGTAALWSPKVLRAGMGAHFAPAPDRGRGVGGPGRPGRAHHRHQFAPGRVDPSAAVAQALCLGTGARRAGRVGRVDGAGRLSVRIAQPGGEESLNVAAAAAICLHASAVART